MERAQYRAAQGNTGASFGRSYGGDANGLKLWSMSAEIGDRTEKLSDLSKKLNATFAAANEQRQNISSEYWQ